MSWCSGSFQLKTVAKKSKKYFESRNKSILWWLTRYHEKFLCYQKIVRGQVIPPTSWKVGVGLLGIIFLNTELNKLHSWHDELIFMHCSLQIKQNIYSIGIFRAPVVTQIIVKVWRNIEKSPIFECLPFYY